MKEFNSIAEMRPYYNDNINTYEFVTDVKLNFNLAYTANIIAKDIIAKDIIAKDIIAKDIIAEDISAKHITARNITAKDINARNINAEDIIAEDINASDITVSDINASDIIAEDINARNISARNISASDINASDINASDIDYYAVCFAYDNINCNSIKGRRVNAKHFCLDGEIIIMENEEKIMTIAEIEKALNLKNLKIVKENK